AAMSSVVGTAEHPLRVAIGGVHPRGAGADDGDAQWMLGGADDAAHGGSSVTAAHVSMRRSSSIPAHVSTIERARTAAHLAFPAALPVLVPRLHRRVPALPHHPVP